jgi:hypothetical protein
LTTPRASGPPFGQLDFVYMPSRDVAADLEQLSGGVGAEPVFAIEAFGARVAMVALGDGPPNLLLADHLEGERPIFVYRVPDLDKAMAELEWRGVDPGPRFGIPHGPCCSFSTPGGHRIALYERARPQADERFAGRRDF